jgi:CBS domain-containing protein
MAQTVRDVMSPAPREISADDTIERAAQVMRDEDIGDVLVMDGDRLLGILTDRDIVVRALAEDLDPETTPVDAIFSGDLVTITPDTIADDAARVMRERAVRRLPVVENGQVLGVVSIGDLAKAVDQHSGLASISAAPPNN